LSALCKSKFFTREKKKSMRKIKSKRIQIIIEINFVFPNFSKAIKNGKIMNDANAPNAIIVSHI